MRGHTRRVRPPRTLFTGRSNAEIVGPPHDSAAQLTTLRRAFEVLRQSTEPGSITPMTPTDEHH